MKRLSRRDANQKVIRKTFEAAGIKFIDTANSRGALLDAIVRKGKTCLFVEIKDGSKPPSHRRLTQKEIAFIKEHRDACMLCETEEDAIALIGYLLGKPDIKKLADLNQRLNALLKES